MSYAGTWQGTYGGIWQGSDPRAPLSPNNFDTGLGKTQRAIVRDGAVDLLQRLLVANGGYVAAIEPTSVVITGGHDEVGIDLLYDLLRGRTPAIAVAVGDKPYTPAGESFSWVAELDLHVYVLGNSLRSRLARIAGDATSLASSIADPGTEVMLEHVEQLLIGQTIGRTPTIKEIRPKLEAQIGTDGAIELWHQRYTVMVTRTINRNRDVDLELKEIRTYHHLADQTGDPTVVTTITEV